MKTNRSKAQCVLLVFAATACGATQTQPSPSAPKLQAARVASSMPLSRFGGHILVTTARVADGAEEKFILDTGAGINVISKAVCARVKCTVGSEHIGKRMSGQALKVPMTQVPMAFAALPSRTVEAAVMDLEVLGLGTEFAGFLSLAYFKDQAFTLDYMNQRVVVESPETLSVRRASGVAVKVRITNEGPEVGAFLPLTLADGSKVEMEVDTGSDSLILNQPFMAKLGFKPDAANVKRLEGKDETDHAFVRFFSKLQAPVRFTGKGRAGESTQDVADLPVMFQDIIYDGLVGDAFLSRFTVTFDLPAHEMIFAPR